MKKTKQNNSAKRTAKKEKAVAKRVAEKVSEQRRQTDGPNRLAREIQKDVHRASKVAVVNGFTKGQRYSDSEYTRYLKVLADPFGAPMGVRCPVNYNPAPSYIQTTLRTTVTDLSFTVGSGMKQLVLYPGTGSPYPSLGAGGSQIGVMDPVANHFQCQAVAASGSVQIISLGPIDMTNSSGGTRYGSAGWYDANATPGSVITSSSAATAYPLFWDTSAPYVGSDAYGHARWQCVAMGIKISNITLEANRGGSIVTVQPNVNLIPQGANTQAELEIYPTFKDHGVGDRGVYVSWIPRPQDMAFGHSQPESGATSSNSLAGAAILVFMNNTTGAVQTYQFQVVYHWQLAGNLVNTIGSNAPHQPALKNLLEPAVAHVINSSPSAHALPRVGAVIAAHDPTSPGPSLSEKLESVGQTVGAVANFAQKFLH